VDSTGFTNYNGTTTTLTGGTYIANAAASRSPRAIPPDHNFGGQLTEENGGQILNTSNSNATP